MFLSVTNIVLLYTAVVCANAAESTTEIKAAESIASEKPAKLFDFNGIFNQMFPGFNQGAPWGNPGGNNFPGNSQFPTGGIQNQTPQKPIDQGQSWPVIDDAKKFPQNNQVGPQPSRPPRDGNFGGPPSTTFPNFGWPFGNFGGQNQFPNQGNFNGQPNQYPNQGGNGGSPPTQYPDQGNFGGSPHNQYPNQGNWGSPQNQYPDQGSWGSPQNQYPDQSNFGGSPQNQYPDQGYFGGGSPLNQYPDQGNWGSQENQYPDQGNFGGSPSDQYPDQGSYGELPQNQYPDQGDQYPDLEYGGSQETQFPYQGSYRPEENYPDNIHGGEMPGGDGTLDSINSMPNPLDHGQPSSPVQSGTGNSGDQRLGPSAILGRPVIVPPSTFSPDQIVFPSSSTENAVRKQCVQDCQTTSEYNPICGTDHVTYINHEKFACARNCGVDVYVASKGRCPR